MDTITKYEYWLSQEDLSADLLKELKEAKGNKTDIADRFYKDLSFGTAGLRGEIGAGSNRMNIYTVGRATQGLAVYLQKHFENPSVCIAYDTRNKSDIFAQTAAEVLAANGVHVYLFDTVHPVPMLSFSVRYLRASAGIVITASHNPKEYNGYKVYNEKGNQITDAAAGEILQYINETEIFKDVQKMDLKEAQAQNRMEYIGEAVDSVYYEKVKELAMRKELIGEKASSLNILYTPLNGSGNVPVRRVLKELGYTNVTIVKEQELLDGNFPTTPYPNPEVPEVYTLAKKLAAEINPDLIFATDPDCDRIGVLIKDEGGEYTVLTGNQVGALLCDYIIRTKKEMGTLAGNSVVVSTVVSTPLTRVICDKNGVSYAETLTGFKYIGEKIDNWEQNKEKTFLFAFEESYGYLAGDFVRDKDAVISASLICEMTLYYREQGKDLFAALHELYSRYGFYVEKNLSFTMKGAEGQEQIAALVDNFRNNYIEILKKQKPAIFEDYKSSVRTIVATGEKERFELPSSNFVKIIFEDGSWFVVRPSGTEPKVKIYLAANAKSMGEANEKLREMEDLARETIV